MHWRNVKRKKKKTTFSVLKRQINKGLKSIKNFNNILIAYEPVWSIGTGVIPKDKELEFNISKIKRIISKKPNINYPYFMEALLIIKIYQILKI